MELFRRFQGGKKMAKEDIKEYFEMYQKFFLFAIAPEKMVSFSNKKKGWNFFKSIMTFFILNSILFSFLISFLNTKEFVTKWIPVLIFIQSIIYIPVCIIPVLTRNIKEMIKIAITEALIVLSTLLYINITIYLLFLFTELYLFYYLYLVISVLTTIYLCFYYPMKVAKNKKVFFGIVTFLCSFGINYVSSFLILSINSKPMYAMVDKIYQESIEKTGEIINLSVYCVEHQQLICDLESNFLETGNPDSLRLLNNQLDLIILKKTDIEVYKDTLIFNRNKSELIVLIDTIDLYEKMKREINTYEYIPKEYHEKLKIYSNELVEIKRGIDDLKNSNRSENEIKKDALLLLEKEQEIAKFLEDSSLRENQMNVSIKTIKEIISLQEQIKYKTKKLSQLTEETQNYWKKRTKFLLL